MWKNYGNTALLLDKFDEITTDLMPRFFWDNYANKSYARELMIFYHSIGQIFEIVHGKGNAGWFDYLENRSQIAEACEKLHEKYSKRFLKFYVFKKKKVDGRVKFPQMNKTQAMKEFLAMGFMHKDDVDPDTTKGYYVYTHTCGELYWPEIFESHQDAIKVQTTLGIPGYTGTTLKKDK